MTKTIIPIIVSTTNQNQSYYTANSSPEEQDYYTVNTEAILLATEIEKVHLPNAIVKNSIIPVKPIFTVALTKLLDALEENIIGKDYLKIIPLVEQQLYTLYHLYPIPILDNRTGLHHVLSFSQKYIARNDDSLMYIPVKNLNACKQIDPHKKLCSELYAYPIDGNAPCEAQLLKNFKEIPKNCQNVLIFGQGYNVQKLSRKRMWVTYLTISIVVSIIIIYVIYKCRKSRRAKKEESSKPIHLEALKRINSILKIRPNIHRTNQEDAEEDPSTSRNSP
ncbi:hypothetical protein NQ318_019747 [Aromia moschata]|uniref:Envelope protein n=1 Tax=Aromia moschata TaxID=1265417 RepID=A0AAV8XCS6_9CUCU|nr:hypothetical protein NQ318_019747 [Aromia moschata]